VSTLEIEGFAALQSSLRVGGDGGLVAKKSSTTEKNWWGLKGNQVLTTDRTDGKDGIGGRRGLVSIRALSVRRALTWRLNGECAAGLKGDRAGRVRICRP